MIQSAKCHYTGIIDGIFIYRKSVWQWSSTGLQLVEKSCWRQHRYWQIAKSKYLTSTYRTCMFNAINTRHCMRFKTSFVRLLFLQPTSPRGIFTHIWSLKWPWPKSNLNQNFVCILNTTAQAPHQVILVTGGLRETNARISAKAIALPYWNVCSSLFIVSWNTT
jgi:hypothetical protein